jgi:serine-type D-Ala-D-Ala carboxypeptidase/endopeptidase (penicillin-binding protein 4)
MKDRHNFVLFCILALLLALAFIWPTTFVSPSVDAEQSVGAITAEAGFVQGSAFSETTEPLLPEPEVAAKPNFADLVDRDSPYADLGRKVGAILDKPAFRNAEWGVDIRSVEDYEPVFVYNHDKLFPPASNAKLFTTAAALDRLGPNFRFQTRLAYEGSLGPGNTLIGDLVLFGQGDPDLSDSIRQSSGQFAHLDVLVRKVKEFGITEIQGDILGDDSYFPFVPYGDGWMASDLTREYGAPVSALSFNNNLITLSIRPGRRIGQPASASIYPSESLLTVVNRAKTVRKGSALKWYRKPGTDQVSVTGHVALRSRGSTHSFTTRDPALYTVSLLRERLMRAGIKVKGAARARHAGDNVVRSSPHLIYIHESLPLLEVISVTNKKSQNLYAEILLRTLGAEIRGIGTDQAGLEVVYEFLQEAGVTRATARLYDGSGLSRYNLITPRAETMLLSHLATKGYFPVFLDTLSISGLDGTLRARMIHTPAFQRVFAKTGSLRGVTTLGGYVRTDAGKIFSFSILNNHHQGPDNAKRAMDQICNLLAQYAEPSGGLHGLPPGPLNHGTVSTVGN